jgi:hypothetical protein
MLRPSVGPFDAPVRRWFQISKQRDAPALECLPRPAELLDLVA